jgi:hypothetical protein
VTDQPTETVLDRVDYAPEVEPHPDAERLVAEGVEDLHRLVRLHQQEPSGRVLRAEVRRLSLDQAQGLLMLAVVGIAQDG